MRRDAPVRLLVCTIACFVVLNVLIAQAIIVAFYPDTGARLGPAGLATLGVLLIVGIAYAVRGWRAYLRKPPAP